MIGQVTTLPATREINKIDITVLQKNQQEVLQAQKTAVTQKLSEYQTANIKTEAALKAGLSSKISQYITNTLNNRVIDRTKLIENMNKPVITEIYCPNPKGVKPRGEFLIIGYNLLSESGRADVSIKLGQSVLACNPLYGNSTKERIWVTMPDFSGISGATTVPLTVKSNGVASDPFSITLLPELVTQELDFSRLTSQLQSDSRFTTPMFLATDITQLSGKHGYILPFPTMLAIYHFCPNATRATVYRGTDEFFLTTQIKNNWIVKSAVYSDSRSVCGTVADNQTSTSFSGLKWNTPYLYMNIGWYNDIDLCFMSSCIITYIIEGPKGTTWY